MTGRPAWILPGSVAAVRQNVQLLEKQRRQSDRGQLREQDREQGQRLQLSRIQNSSSPAPLDRLQKNSFLGNFVYSGGRSVDERFINTPPIPPGGEYERQQQRPQYANSAPFYVLLYSGYDYTGSSSDRAKRLDF